MSYACSFTPFYSVTEHEKTYTHIKSSWQKYAFRIKTGVKKIKQKNKANNSVVILIFLTIIAVNQLQEE